MLKRKTDIPQVRDVREEVWQATVAPTEDDYARSLEYRSLGREKIHIVSFHLAKDEYAFEISEAVEVLKNCGLTAVPRTSGFIKGILSVRGEMIPVIDLKTRLGMGSSGDQLGRILITAVEDLKVGFIVDRLSGVQEVPSNCIVVSDGIKDCSPGSLFVKGVISASGRTISLLNLGSLIDISGR